MIKVIGTKRLALVVVFVLLNALLAAGLYMYFAPQSEQAERELRNMRNEIAHKRSETSRLRDDFDQIQEQRDFFERLEQAGFFTNQNRLVARRRIEDVQERTGVLSAGYNIGSGEVIRNADVQEAGHVILRSDINFTVSAMDDLEIYNFIFWLENVFPGHMMVESLQMRRSREINEAVLRRIGSGSPTVLVEADIRMVWRTMVPEDIVRDGTRTISGGF